MLLVCFFNDTATTEIYTLSLHDALPILILVGTVVAVGTYPYDDPSPLGAIFKAAAAESTAGLAMRSSARAVPRSEEHTSELQSRQYLVCRLLLEKKKKSSRLSSTGRTRT